MTDAYGNYHNFRIRVDEFVHVSEVKSLIVSTGYCCIVLEVSCNLVSSRSILPLDPNLFNSKKTHHFCFAQVLRVAAYLLAPRIVD